MNTFCADLQIKLGVRMRFLECLGTGKWDEGFGELGEFPGSKCKSLA